jgi:ubiquitin C-terminal hydrolase
MASDNNSMMRGIIGLANLGNTCYMNSAIQAFRHCPEWTLFCKKGGPLDEKIKDKESNPAKVALAYQDLIQSIWAGSGPAYVKPLGFYEQLKQVVKGTLYEDFIRRTPQDAHEFLVWLLDQIYMSTQREVNIQIQNSESLPNMTLQAITGWKNAFEKQYSPLTDLIFGMMRIQYNCGGCNAVHNRWETFNSLKVSLANDQNGGPLPLMDCIKKELEDEYIDGYDCDSCKNKTRTRKVQTIWKLPRVLILTLKRFTPMGTRDNSNLNYNGENLEFQNVFSEESVEESKQKSYRLFATIDHHGHHMGGHYTSQCLSPVWKNWHRYDDEAAFKLDKPHFGPETYILMFR